jgi:hypothetical protein
MPVVRDTVSADTDDAPRMPYGMLDAGRRVGWARAFDAERRADAAEYDVNILRGDVRMIVSFAARAYGALEITCAKRINELFRGDNHELKSWLPSGPLHQGQDAMRKLLGKQTDELNRLRAKIAELKSGEHSQLRDMVFRAGRLHERQWLVTTYGFTCDDDLLEWLRRSTQERQQ